VQVDYGRRLNFTWLVPPSSFSRRRWTPVTTDDLVTFDPHETPDPTLISVKFLELGRVRSVHRVLLSNCSSLSLLPQDWSSEVLYSSKTSMVSVVVSAMDRWSLWNRRSTTTSTLSHTAASPSTPTSCPLVIQYQGTCYLACQNGVHIYSNDTC